MGISLDGGIAMCVGQPLGSFDAELVGVPGTTLDNAMVEKFNALRPPVHHRGAEIRIRRPSRWATRMLRQPIHCPATGL
jgi:hypothetical protein